MINPENFNNSLNKIISDTKNWGELVRLEEGKDIEIIRNQKDGSSKYVKTKERNDKKITLLISTFYHKIMKTMSRAENTVQNLINYRKETVDDIDKLMINLSGREDKNPVDIKTAIIALYQLKENLKSGAGKGFRYLSEIYCDKSPGGRNDIPQILQREQRRINENVVGKIDRSIIKLGSILENMKDDESNDLFYEIEREDRQKAFKELRKFKDKTSSSEDLAAEGFLWLNERLSPSLEDEPTISPSDIDKIVSAHVDSTSEQHWKEIQELTRQKGLNNYLIDNPPEDEVRSLLKDSTVTTILKNKKGEQVELPTQFSVDLHRYSLVTVNDETVYNSSMTLLYDPVTAYKKIVQSCKDCYDSTSNTADQVSNEKLAARIAALTTQGVLAQVTTKGQLLYSTEESPVSVGNGKIILQLYFPERGAPEQTVRVVIKCCFYVIDMLDPMASAVTEERQAFLAKRVIDIPLKEIQDENFCESDDGLPLPGLVVEDTFSKILPNFAYAETLIDYF